MLIIRIAMGIIGIVAIAWAGFAFILFFEGEIRFPFLVMAILTAMAPFSVIMYQDYLDDRFTDLTKGRR